MKIFNRVSTKISHNFSTNNWTDVRTYIIARKLYEKTFGDGMNADLYTKVVSMLYKIKISIGKASGSRCDIFSRRHVIAGAVVSRYHCRRRRVGHATSSLCILPRAPNSLLNAWKIYSRLCTVIPLNWLDNVRSQRDHRWLLRSAKQCKNSEIDCEFVHHAPVIPFNSTMHSRAVFFSQMIILEYKKLLCGKTRKSCS